MPQPVLFSGNYFKAHTAWDYFFLLSSSGISIFNKNNFTELNYIPFSGTLTDFYFPQDKTYFYITTSGNGVLRCNLPETIDQTSNLSKVLSFYKNEPASSNTINCIDGLGDVLYIGTPSGVEVLSGDSSRYSSQYFSGIVDIKVTDFGDLYYISPSGLSFKEGPITTNWTSPTHVFNLSSIPSLTTLTLFELDVKSPQAGTTAVVLATESGVILINNRIPQYASDIIYFTETV